MSMIIDKMDSAKNVVPGWTARTPKDVGEDTLKNLLTLHIVGVIIHGTPDKRYAPATCLKDQHAAGLSAPA